MISYCVKQKKQTKCVPDSERVVKAKDGRLMMKCTCAECEMTKAKFIKEPGKELPLRRALMIISKQEILDKTKEGNSHAHDQESKNLI